MSLVPNSFPSASETGQSRLAIVGEAPGLEEASWRICERGHGYPGERWAKGQLLQQTRCPACGTTAFVQAPRPFVGPSGRLLDDCLVRAGFHPSQAFRGNVARSSLTKGDALNDPAKLDLHQLSDDLLRFKPNCVLVLGNAALRAFHPWHWRDSVSPTHVVGEDLFGEQFQQASKVRKGDFAIRISDWRGSIFEGHLPISGGWTGKCVAAYHPAAVLRTGPQLPGMAGANPEFLPLLRFDVKRAVEEAARPTLDVPQRHFPTDHTAEEIAWHLEAMLSSRRRLAFDLEGYATSGMSDCSLTAQSESALWIPFKKIDGSPWWSPADQQLLMGCLQTVLEDPAVPKVLHNALYEMTVLKMAHNITLRGVAGDTMLLWHEFQPELDKALDVAASLMTRQPFWKHMRLGAETEQERAEYNCTDSCVTLELEQAILPLLTPGQRQHYEFNLSLLEPMSDMMLRGIRFDVEGRRQLVAELQRDLATLQGELDGLAGISAPTLAEVAEIVCYAKRKDEVWDWPDVVTYAKPNWKKEAGQVEGEGDALQ